MYITGIKDEETFDNILLLDGMEEPEDGDWTETARRWYQSMADMANRYMAKYQELKNSIK